MLRETADKETIDFSMLRIKEPFEITLWRNSHQIPLTLTFRLKEFLGAMCFILFADSFMNSLLFYTFMLSSESYTLVLT